MDGELYFKAAVALTDRHPGTQFREMLGHDLLASQMERLYFQDEWRGLELYGWNSFCLKMEEEGQGKWLAKIKELDSEVMLGHLETQLMQASRDGKAPNRALLEATVKALQGVSALARVNADAGSGVGRPVVDIKFSGVDINPITGEVYPGTPKVNDIENIDTDIAEPEETDNEGAKNDSMETRCWL